MQDACNKSRFSGIKFTKKDNQYCFLFHGDRWGREQFVTFMWTKDVLQPILYLSAPPDGTGNPGVDFKLITYVTCVVVGYKFVPFFYNFFLLYSELYG